LKCLKFKIPKMPKVNEFCHFIKDGASRGASACAARATQ
jgi:hypothetical protein